MVDFWQGVEFSHMLLKEYIIKGDTVVDATAGNGHDTVYLANLVGREGKVWSFDIQKAAIYNTRKKLMERSLENRVELIKDGHQNLEKYINKKIKAMVFNLGYLPGGDKEITTEKNTTLAALDKGLSLLTNGGLIVLVIYTGHPGGIDELNTILCYTSELDENIYNVLKYNFINQDTSPQVLAIIKR
ncbi:MAG: class I SAM-dependent methyltransferase [Bacillota bacterium]